jgi:hypothetical protein
MLSASEGFAWPLRGPTPSATEGVRVRRHERGVCGWLLSGAIALGVGAGAPEAMAAPVRSTGQAKAADTKSPSLSQTRARALRRARRAALEAALRQLGGSVDPEARKAVLDSADAWTGAYRVLSEHSDGQDVELELEVEIDLVRLQKRVAKHEGGASGGPSWALGDVGSAEGCGDAGALAELVRTELLAQGAVAAVAEAGAEPTKTKKGKLPALDVALDCQVLGAVEHTLLHAVRVRATATADGRTIALASTPAFAATPPEAVTAGVQSALSDMAGELARHESGHVRLRVQSPLPAMRIRRLETAMRNSVLGVDEVEVGGVDGSVVELHVRGELTAKALSRALGQLALPGFSLTIVRVEPPDVLTVRLQ